MGRLGEVAAKGGGDGRNYSCRNDHGERFCDG